MVWTKRCIIQVERKRKKDHETEPYLQDVYCNMVIILFLINFGKTTEKKLLSVQVFGSIIFL